MRLLCLILILLPGFICAKDFGDQGHLFAIDEKNLLTQIEQKLNHMAASGDLEIEQARIKERVMRRAMNPPAIDFVHDAFENESRSYDPSVTAPFDLSDHKGKVFIKKGQKVNPLSMMPMSETLFFINGDNEDQIEWLKPQLDNNAVVILTRGSPQDLHLALDHVIYFDQEGLMSKKFGLNAVPTRISQDGMKLKIETFKLSEGAP